MKENNLKGILKLYESFTEEEYWASKCLSQSILKNVYDNPEVLIDGIKTKKGEWLVFGTLVDLLLTEFSSIEDKVVINNHVPSDQFKSIAEYMANNNITVDHLSDDKIIDEVYIQSGSSVNWLVPTKRKKIMEECIPYLDLLTKHRDKIIVTTELWNEATNVAQVFKTHKWTKNLFISEKEQHETGVEIFYQLKIKYLYQDLMCKSKLDIVHIDHVNQIITPYDIKTGTDSIRKFVKSSIFDYKYCYQGALYKEGLVNFISKIEPLKDYEIDDFRFIYINRLKPTYPLIVQIDTVLHNKILKDGILNNYYDIPSLKEVFNSAKYQLNKIDEGETNLVPYYLNTNFGELILTVDTDDNIYF